MKHIFYLLALLALVGCVPITPAPNFGTPSPVPTGTSIVVPTKEPTGQCLIVTASEFLNFRSGPSTSDSVIGYLRHGQQVSANKPVGIWWQVKSGDTIGYVHSHYVENCYVQKGNKPKRR